MAKIFNFSDTEKEKCVFFQIFLCQEIEKFRLRACDGTWYSPNGFFSEREIGILLRTFDDREKAIGTKNYGRS